MQYEVIVELKQEVLDPAGRAIHQTLNRLGHGEVKGLRVAKRFVLTLDDKTPSPDQFAMKIAKEFLANPVSEVPTVKRLDA